MKDQENDSIANEVDPYQDVFERGESFNYERETLNSTTLYLAQCEATFQ